MFKLTLKLQKFRNQVAIFITLVVLSLLLLSCSSVQYYSSLVHGHAEVINLTRDMDEVLADESINQKTRDKLRQLKRARGFAVHDLYLPDTGSYRRYADLGRKYVVWNVIAAPELSVEAHEWCLLIVGCIQYRGYYSKAEAKAYANGLEQEGYDVYVAGVSAYSTLGWFDDPLLNTMLYRTADDRVNLLFHEMAHQKLFIKNDSKFNEAFATFVAKEGVIRWLNKTNQASRVEVYKNNLDSKARFYRLLRQAREGLEAIYSSSRSDENKRLSKQKAFIELQQKYAALKQNTAGLNYDAWMAQDLNNAHLALLSTYNAYVPWFEMQLARHNGDLEAFYASLQPFTEMDVAQRKEIMSQK